MEDTRRRTFIMALVAGGSALAASRASSQAGAPAVSETDPQASALGYKADAGKVDAAKYPQHQATQVCSGCSFYQGKPTDEMAPCQLLAGKQVAGKGWCVAWASKA